MLDSQKEIIQNITKIMESITFFLKKISSFTFKEQELTLVTSIYNIYDLYF